MLHVIIFIMYLGAMTVNLYVAYRTYKEGKGKMNLYVFISALWLIGSIIWACRIIRGTNDNLLCMRMG